jgi:hypothetical protein
MMAATDIALSLSKGAIKGHKTAVIAEAAISAGTRNHNPNKSPIAPAAKANNMVSSPSMAPASASGRDVDWFHVTVARSAFCHCSLSNWRVLGGARLHPISWSLARLGKRKRPADEGKTERNLKVAGAVREATGWPHSRNRGDA